MPIPAACPCPPRRHGAWDDWAPDPACHRHAPPSGWPDPPVFAFADATFTAHAEGAEWGKAKGCLRCGAVVSNCLDTSARSSGYRNWPDGAVVHAEWHREQDWLLAIGPKAPLYAAAGFSFDEARAAELSDDPPLPSALRAAAALVSRPG